MSCIDYRLPICTFQIRFENAVKTQVIRTVFLTQILNSQLQLLTDNALNCSETHLPVYQSIQKYCVTHNNIAISTFRLDLPIRKLKRFNIDIFLNRHF